MTSRRSFLFGVGGAVALGVLGACGDDPPTASGADPAEEAPAPDGPPNTVVIKNFVFSPAQITVAPGTVISVDNQDTADHTLTAKDKSFDTGNLAGKERGSITAPMKPGSYPYICDIHQYMSGTLTVTAM